MAKELDFLNKYIYKRDRRYVSSGSRIKPVYQRYTTDNGFYSVHKVGEHNLYEEIQSNNTSCSISEMINRFRAGDLSAIPQYTPTEIDITDVPDNIHEMHKKIEAVREVFDHLPVEIRQSYAYSFDNFLRNPNLSKIMENSIATPSEPAKTKNKGGDLENE